MIKLYNIQSVPKFNLNHKRYFVTLNNKSLRLADTLGSSRLEVSWDTVSAQGAFYSTIAKSFRLWLFCLLAL